MNLARAALFLLLSYGLIAGAAAQDPDKVKLGSRVYNNYCATCHGDEMVNSGNATFDLRRLRANERTRFETSVTNGKGQMPPWKGVLSPEEMDQIWHYIRVNANDK